ncbi:MAG: VCBS repeat-containing protein [FCB group bacterium]|jgi:hypothetical protein|nr:VCBS repeat-containing protein [FCB group bacterium]
MMRCFAMVLLVFCVCGGALAGPLVSGEPIVVGTADGRGPLAAQAIQSIPVGAAFVYGSAQPDLFVSTTKYGLETGLFLYRWVATAEGGVPVFGERKAVAFPFESNFPPMGSIVQTQDGAVHAVWVAGTTLVHGVFDKDAMRFDEAGRVEVEGLPRGAGSMGLALNADGSVEVLLGVSAGAPSELTGVNSRNPEYRPYDGAGVWRGGFPYVGMYAVRLPRLFEGPAEPARRVSPTDHEVRSSYVRMTQVNFGPGHERDVLTGSLFGALHFYRNTDVSGLALEAQRMAVGADSNALRHPIITPSPVAYPDPVTGLSNVVAGGEGGLHFYRFQGKFTEAGTPVFDAPRPVLEENARLYAGTLPVPNVVDWDGDGLPDLVSGNSDGKVLFFRNIGRVDAPAFGVGVPLEAGGRVIHVQPGYGQDIQGPGEARWGYTCPTVADWNGDGLPDLLMSDSTSRHTVYMNRGEKGKPVLDAEHPLYFEDLDMHGTWRVKPAIAKLGERMAYVALDDQDQFHLYWRVDDYQIADGGKLTLEDGSVIGANYLSAGGTGRLKLNLVDWNRDGATDLIVGTPRHASVPNPKTGLPQSLGKPGAAILFLRNVGSDSAPVFRFPELMCFKGEPIYLGQHACGPAPAFVREGKGPDLVCGEESGRIIYFAREDLSPVE